MFDDIVTRLREGNGQGCKCYADYWYECACDAIWAEQYILEAADEIERLREQNDYLKANVEMLLAEARAVRGE